MSAPDVCILWLTVHGGAFHKLIVLHERLVEAGLTCELIFSAGPPRGLKIGVDVPEALVPELEARGVRFLPRAEALQAAEASLARLLITDAHGDPDLPGLIARARSRGAVTAQLATLLADFTCHGADHLLLQHPLTLFFELEYHHTRESQRFFQATGIHFTGNIFFEPTVNTLVNTYASREEFFAKYGFDPARPLCLWLPNRADIEHPSYGAVLKAAKDAGLNLAVKLHPWEYVFKKHGVDTWGLGRTSDEMWNVPAVEEPDGTWAYAFCDLAVMRTSATCLEMPFWEKPSVLLPETRHSGFTKPQAEMVASCAYVLKDEAALTDLLKGPLPPISPAAYAVGRARVRLDCTRDAYTQTVEAVQAILAAPESAGRPGSPADIRRLYDREVFPAMRRGLPPGHRVKYELGRLWRSLTA